MDVLLGGAVFALYLAAQVLAVIAGSRLPPTGRSASPPADRRPVLMRASET
jgi:hypothetical protein